MFQVIGNDAVGDFHNKVEVFQLEKRFDGILMD